MLKIVHVPNDVLTTPTLPVKKFDGSIQKLIKNMESTLNSLTELIGVGLAAPQVGSNLSLFIMKPTQKSQIRALVNPRIVSISPIPKARKSSSKKKRKPSRFEGCLSIPKIWSPVKRSQKVLVEYQTPEGETKKD